MVGDQSGKFLNRGRGNPWPIPSNATNFEPGIASAVAFPPLTLHILSESPLIIRVGIASDFNLSVLSADLRTVTYLRSMLGAS